jgi:hypothetical protein
MKKRIEEIMADFDPNNPAPDSDLRFRQAVTVWLPPTYKALYDRLQKGSNRKVSKLFRDVFIAVLDDLDKKAS